MLKRIVASTMLMPALTLSLYATPALAYFDFLSDDTTVMVKNSNSAEVKNYVDTSASTGGNTANGGSGGGAGDGGDVKWSGANNNGGNGGDGGNGGVADVITGNASAKTLVSNDVNSNKTKISSSCDCVNENGDVELKVKNYNSAYVGNDVKTKAKTGHNEANGGDAGCGCEGGGDGGDVKGSGEGNDGGNGGDAGDGGYGFVSTGDAYSKTKVFNKVNTNVTRIRR